MHASNTKRTEHIVHIFRGVSVTMTKKNREAFNLIGKKDGMRKGWEERKGRNNINIFNLNIC